MSLKSVIKLSAVVALGLLMPRSMHHGGNGKATDDKVTDGKVTKDKGANGKKVTTLSNQSGTTKELAAQCVEAECGKKPQ